MADYFGNLLIEPRTLEHRAANFRLAVELIRQAQQEHGIEDTLVVVRERPANLDGVVGGSPGCRWLGTGGPLPKRPGRMRRSAKSDVFEAIRWKGCKRLETAELRPVRGGQSLKCLVSASASAAKLERAVFQTTVDERRAKVRAAWNLAPSETLTHYPAAVRRARELIAGYYAQMDTRGPMDIAR